MIFEIGHFRFEGNVFRLHVVRRATATGLVVVNQMELVGRKGTLLLSAR